MSSSDIGGFDIRLTHSLATNQSISIIANMIYDEGATQNWIIKVGKDGTGDLYFEVTDCMGKVYTANFGAYNQTDIRVVVHNSFISCYLDHRWLFTWAFPTIFYGNLEVSIQASATITLSSLMVVELCDWREAIWFEIENTMQNAVSSVLQERPVELLGKTDGSLSFFYDPSTRPTVSYEFYEDGVATGKCIALQHRIQYGSKEPVASDSIVYGTDVFSMVSPEAARSYGFQTKVVRIPNVDTGQRKIAEYMQNRALQSRKYHQVSGRAHPALERGDALTIHYDMPGTSTGITETLIVEDMTLDLMNLLMQVSGRNYSPTYNVTPYINLVVANAGCDTVATEANPTKNLSVANASVVTSAEDVTVSKNLVVADAASTSGVDAAGRLVQVHNLNVADGACLATAEVPHPTKQSNLAGVADSSVDTQTDNVVLT